MLVGINGRLLVGTWAVMGIEENRYCMFIVRHGQRTENRATKSVHVHDRLELEHSYVA